MTCISTTEAGALKFAFEHKCAIIRVKVTSANAASANQNHLCIKFVNAKIKSGISNGSYVGGYFVGYPYGVELKSGITIDAGKLYDIATNYQNGYATGIPD